ncbi:MAG: hypothetical protein ACXAEF_03360 [Candidatus Thorarchaeota archaeon]
MIKPTMKEISLTFMIFLLMLFFVPQSVEARDAEVNEGFFDVRVTLRFDDGEFLEPDPSFSIEYSGVYVDIGLQVELVQVRGSFVDLLYLKVNGVSLLFTTGSIRVHSSEYGPTLEIEAYGEAFVAYTDSYYKDTINGQIFSSQNQTITTAIIGTVTIFIVVMVLVIWKRRR